MLETIFSGYASIFIFKDYIGFCTVSTILIWGFLFLSAGKNILLKYDHWFWKNVLLSFFLFLFHFYHLSGFFLSPKWRSEERTGIVTCQLSIVTVTHYWTLHCFQWLWYKMSVFVKLKFREVCFILAALPVLTGLIQNVKLLWYI